MFTSYDDFEAHVEGICTQLRGFPYEKVAFLGKNTPEVVYLFFAIWKLGKIACPLNTRLPSHEEALEKLGTKLFTPQMPKPEVPHPWEWNEDNLATLLFTSASSGVPKIACHTIGNHLYSARGLKIPLEKDDCWFLSLPLFHVGGIAILFRSYLKRTLVDFSLSEKVTHLSLVPTQLKRLLESKPSLSRLKYILLGGAPISHFQTPWRVIPTYGMTEMSSHITLGGIVHPYAKVKCASDGEIFVKGETLFQGYYDKVKGIKLPVDEGGWFATNDLGRWNKEGKLEIVGRKDNLFISGGENIQPEEVEAELKKLPGITEAFVVPLSDPEFGARPVVFLDKPLSVEEVQKGLKTRLPKYKIPLKIFPLSNTSDFKRSRQELAALAKKLSSGGEEK